MRWKFQSRNVLEEHQKNLIKATLGEGLSPTQAVESARLITHTPTIDAALEQTNVLKAKAEKVIGLDLRGKPQNKYEAYKDAEGNRVTFEDRATALEYQDANPDLKDFTIVNDGRGKYYLGEVINKEVSMDAGEKGATLHGTLPADSPLDIENLPDENVQTNLGKGDADVDDGFITPVDSRPSVSIEDVLGTLSRATKEPVVFDELLGNDDIGQTLKELKFTREFLQKPLQERKSFWTML